MQTEELVQEYQNGNDQALEAIVHNNVGMVKFLADKRYHFGLKGSQSFDDLEQESWIALIEAAKKYRYGESSFSSYASSLIKFRIYKVVHRNIPRLAKSDFNSEGIQFKRLDEPVLNNSNELLRDSIEDDEALSQFEDVEDRLDREILKKDLSQLIHKVFKSDERSKQLLISRYLSGGKPKLSKDIAPMLDCSTSHVSYLQSKALKTIRNSIPGKEFMDKYKVYFLDEVKSRINETSPEKAVIQQEFYEELSNKLKYEKGWG